jgi:hypothetical protein
MDALLTSRPEEVAGHRRPAFRERIVQVCQHSHRLVTALRDSCIHTAEKAECLKNGSSP